MADLYRAEIVSNQSVQEDITELLEQEIPSIQYTVIPEIHGRGGRSKKLGDTVWPEMNFALFTYVEKEDTREKIDIVELNRQIAEIVAKEEILRKEIDEIIKEIEV